jgi:hypothetical protein
LSTRILLCARKLRYCKQTGCWYDVLYFLVGTMFNPTQVVIEAFVHELQAMYARIYGVLEPTYPGIIAFIGRGAMENIANSDAPYHNAEHTMMVTLVGQEILRGKHIREGGVTPRDWLHFISSCVTLWTSRAREASPTCTI